MRIFALLAALAAFAEAIPQPAATPAKTKPHYAQASPEISPPPQFPPLPYHLQEYRELLKRSTLAFEKKLDEPCPVDCNNGFCCPSSKVCLSQNSDDKVSVICGHPELRKRQSFDIDALLSSLSDNPYTFSFDFNSWFSSYTSEYAYLFSGMDLPAFTNNAEINQWLSSLTATAPNPVNTESSSYNGDPYPGSSRRRKKKSSLGGIVGGVVGAIVVLALIIGAVFLIRRKRTQQVPPTPAVFVPQGQPVPPNPDPAYVQPPGPNPEKAYYQPAVPGAVEADGVGQPMPPQYTGNSQQQQQPYLQQEQPYPQQQQQPYPQQQQQPYPQQQQQPYPQQQQQPYQQPGAVYHEVHNTSSPPPGPQATPQQGYQPYPPPQSPPPQQYHQQPGAVYHEMDIAPVGR